VSFFNQNDIRSVWLSWTSFRLLETKQLTW